MDRNIYLITIQLPLFFLSGTVNHKSAEDAPSPRVASIAPQTSQYKNGGIVPNCDFHASG
jgi:hypothetical protein